MNADSKVHSVKIYSKKFCPYCTRAKQFFAEKGIAFEEIDLSDDIEQLEALKKQTRHRTVPQIFINGEFIGGYTELIDAVNSGALKL